MEKLELNIKNLKKNWWKIIFVSLVISFLNALAHGMLPSNDSGMLGPSIIAQMGLLPLAYILYGTIWFSLLGSIFVLIQDQLSGNKIIKGLKYGLFFALLTVIVYFEPLPHSSSSSIETVWMLADCLPFILLGALMGLLFAENGSKKLNIEKGSKLKEIPLIAVISLMVIVGRLFNYVFFNIYSSFSNLMLNTIIWVLLWGITIGVLYYFLIRPALIDKSRKGKTLWFAAIFGVYLVMFNLAFAIIVELPLMPMGALTLIDMVFRTFSDVLFASLGVLIFEYTVEKIKN